MSIERLLIFRIGHLGDTLIALPALWAIRRLYPNAKISLLTNVDTANPQFVSPIDVLPREGLVDNFIAYPANLGLFRGTPNLVRLAKLLRRERFDAAIYLMPRVRSKGQMTRDRGFFKLAGVRDLVGTSFLQKNQLDNPVRFPTPAVEPEWKFLLRMVEDLGVAASNVETHLLLTDDERTAGEAWLAEALSTRSPQRLVAIAPGAKFDFKCWDEERYAEVVSKLIEQKGYFPIVFGGREDLEKGNRLIRSWGTGANAAGALTVRESAAVLGKCKLYLGNDTGTMHLAAAMKVPIVALFSSMDYMGRWDPFGSDNAVIRSLISCDACLGLGGNMPHKCMSSIGIGEVWTAVLDIIESSK